MNNVLCKKIIAICIAVTIAGCITPIRTSAEESPSLTYQAHVQSYGWMNSVSDSQTAGTTGKAKRMEGLRINVSSEYSGDIVYQAHVQSYGWQSEVRNGELAGTTGMSKRLEAVKISLTGDLLNAYDVFYRVHVRSYGWLAWVSNGNVAGTVGEARRIEAIEIRLVPKGEGIESIVDLTDYEQRIINAINKKRSEAGLTTLEYSEELTLAARRRAAILASDFTANPEYTKYKEVLAQMGISYNISAENTVGGKKTPEEIIDILMGIAVHRDRMMNPEFTKIGSGCVYSDARSDIFNYHYSQIFTD